MKIADRDLSKRLPLHILRCARNRGYVFRKMLTKSSSDCVGSFITNGTGYDRNSSILGVVRYMGMAITRKTISMGIVNPTPGRDISTYRSLSDYPLTNKEIRFNATT